MARLRSETAAQGVVGVGVGEHVPGLFGPGQGLRGGDATVDLERAALEDPVFGPTPRVVLHARHLDPRDRPGGREAPDPVAVAVAGEVPGDRRVSGHDLDQSLAVVGMDAEVVVRSVVGFGAPDVVVPEDEHGPVGVRGQVVQPVEGRRRHPARRPFGHRGVDQGQPHPGEVHVPRSRRGHGGSGSDVVVATDVVQAFAERRVRVQEGLILLRPARRGQVAFDHHGGRVDRRHLGDRAPVHGHRVGCRPVGHPEGRTHLHPLDDPALDLAEVHVVHGGEGAQVLAVGSGQRAHPEPVEVVVLVAGQAFMSADLVTGVHHDLVIGHRGQLHPSGRFRGRH